MKTKTAKPVRSSFSAYQVIRNNNDVVVTRLSSACGSDIAALTQANHVCNVCSLDCPEETFTVRFIPFCLSSYPTFTPLIDGVITK